MGRPVERSVECDDNSSLNVRVLVDKICEAGVASIKEYYLPRSPERVGGIAGFKEIKRFKDMDTLEDSIYEARKQVERYVFMRSERSLSRRDYVKSRYRLLQMEYAYEILKVAYKYPVVSARAVIQYSRLVGLKGMTLQKSKEFIESLGYKTNTLQTMRRFKAL